MGFTGKYQIPETGETINAKEYFMRQCFDLMYTQEGTGIGLKWSDLMSMPTSSRLYIYERYQEKKEELQEHYESMK